MRFWLLVEGFREKSLKSFAASLGRSLEPEWKSLKLIEECLIGTGVETEAAKTAMSSLRTLRDTRNVVKGHAASTKRRELEKRAKTNFGSYRVHFKALAADCDAALALIISKIM